MKILLKGLKPLSTNDMYRSVTQRKKDANGKTRTFAKTVSTSELIEYKAKIKEVIHARTGGKPIEPRMYNLAIEISYPNSEIYFKNGGLKKKDVSNTIKALEDAIYEALEVDDKYNNNISIRRFMNEEDTFFIYIEITEGPTQVEIRGSDYYDNLLS